MSAQQQASARNRRFIQQMANRADMAAMARESQVMVQSPPAAIRQPQVQSLSRIKH